MSPDLCRYVADQLALETSVLKERPQGEGGASGKTKAKGGKVMPELGERRTACIHSSTSQLGSLNGERGSHFPAALAACGTGSVTSAFA